MSYELKAVIHRIASAVKDDAEANPEMTRALYKLDTHQMRQFILNDIKRAFTGKKPMLPRLAEVLRDLGEWQVRYNRSHSMNGMGQINVSNIISTAISAAASAGSAYLQYKAAKDAEDLAKKQMALQQQAQAAQQAAAQAAQAEAQAQQASAASEGIPTWMIVAGLGVVALIAFMAMRR